MNLLVTGGAGYMGSHMANLLLARGFDVTVVDDLSAGRRAAVCGGNFIQGDMGDRRLLDRIFSSAPFDGVLHFAASIQFGESESVPGKYYENNVVKTLRMLEAMHEHRVNNLVFSSSAAIYGEPAYLPINEVHPKAPVNAYGASKWMIETVLEHYYHAYGLASISLRYVNASGADPDCMPGIGTRAETQLLPLAVQAASRTRPQSIFSDTTIRRPMAPVSETTCMSWICARHICWRCKNCGMRPARLHTTSAMATAFRHRKS
ncbi:hypothetical protein BH11PSE11_BH11PSE11_21030 [soil metagenome]